MLYIVGTPIGNLEDLSIRQARVISASEIILSEDTRSTGILLQKIKELFPNVNNSSTTRPEGGPPLGDPQLVSYYKDNEFEKLPQILELVRSGKHISVISQAGMPLISDPGFLLVKHLVKEGLPYTVIPGPTAISTALVYSGFNPAHHMFIGFFPKKSSDVKKQIEKLKELAMIDKELVFVAYESPNRLRNTLRVLHDTASEAEIVVCRELTKKFEEIVRGKPLDLASRDYKGEITLVLKV